MPLPRSEKLQTKAMKIHKFFLDKVFFRKLMLLVKAILKFTLLGIVLLIVEINGGL